MDTLDRYSECWTAWSPLEDTDEEEDFLPDPILTFEAPCPSQSRPHRAQTRCSFPKPSSRLTTSSDPMLLDVWDTFKWNQGKLCAAEGGTLCWSTIRTAGSNPPMSTIRTVSQFVLVTLTFIGLFFLTILISNWIGDMVVGTSSACFTGTRVRPTELFDLEHCLGLVDETNKLSTQFVVLYMDWKLWHRVLLWGWTVMLYIGLLLSYGAPLAIINAILGVWILTFAYHAAIWSFHCYAKLGWMSYDWTNPFLLFLRVIWWFDGLGPLRNTTLPK